MKKTTSINHPPAVVLPPGNRPLVMPIYQSVKFDFETLDDTLEFLRGDRPGFFYSRAANPTTRQLELQLAGMQDRDDCLVTGSGVGAISQALLALTRQGDHILCFVETYNPTRYLIRRLLGRFGVNSTMLSIEDLAGIERVLKATPTRLIVFESPTNPVTKVADIEAITRLAQAHGALTLLDNTFAGLHQHGQYPIDIFIHSLTKYASGAGDVMGGAVIARSDIIRSLRGEFGTLGGVLDPHAAFLIARGLKTYYLRYAAQTLAAQHIAEMLAVHPGVAKVHYPGLPTHPQHELARRQMEHFGTVVTLDVHGGDAAAARFADALQYFSITASLGSTESLVVPPQMMSSRDLTAEQATMSGVTDGTVRLSIGLEDIEDLIGDLNQALERARAWTATLKGTPARDGFHMPAESAPHAGCWMLWPERPDNWRRNAQPAQAAFAAVAAAIARFEPLTMGVSAAQFDVARAQLPPRIRVVELSHDDAWMRDVGPTGVVNAAGELRGIDWPFNAWGGFDGGLYAPWELDDHVARKVLEIEGVARYRAPIINEGGAIHVDGEGTALVTEQCLLNRNRNPKLSRTQIERHLKEYLGVTRIIWLGKGVFNDETDGHIDNLACFVRPGEVCLTWCDDPADPQYAISGDALARLLAARDARDRPLKVHKLPAPGLLRMSAREAAGIRHKRGSHARVAGWRLAGSYVNFYLANGGLVMPLLDPDTDRAAARVLKRLFPDRKVVGVPAREILLGGGNIHCITQQVPQRTAAKVRESAAA